jgi:hypothetical protein
LAKLRRDVQDRLAAIKDEELDAEAALAAALEKKRILHAERLRILKQEKLLSSRERKMFARELALIEELERLETEAAVKEAQAPTEESVGELSGPSGPADASAFDFGLSPVPSEFLGLEIPGDWSFSDFLAVGGTSGG